MTLSQEEHEREHLELDPVLSRIPIQWGKTVRCGQGWYPLIVELDEKIAEIFPDYEIQQVKEKFGTLRYYWSADVPLPACCLPHEAAGELETHLSDANVGADAHDQEAEDELMHKFEADTERVEELIHDAEFRSASTCEACSAPGTLLCADPVRCVQLW